VGAGLGVGVELVEEEDVAGVGVAVLDGSCVTQVITLLAVPGSEFVYVE
jgi:hypothetical protein